VEFGWHATKRDKTIADRGIDFVRMMLGWSDPKRQIAEDTRKDYGEKRFNMLANIQGTQRGSVTWIISARKANKREQRRYEQK
jgi:uncharacterized DUF497 family protein